MTRTRPTFPAMHPSLPRPPLSLPGLLRAIPTPTFQMLDVPIRVAFMCLSVSFPQLCHNERNPSLPSNPEGPVGSSLGVSPTTVFSPTLSHPLSNHYVCLTFRGAFRVGLRGACQKGG
jgi:hypothetical protein